jgi:hypothetical protein
MRDREMAKSRICLTCCKAEHRISARSLGFGAAPRPVYAKVQFVEN